MSVPPYSSGTVMPCRPRSPSFFHRSTGKRLSLSMRAARGAISFDAKSRIVSRICAMSSPRSKASAGTWDIGSPWMCLDSAEE